MQSKHGSKHAPIIRLSKELDAGIHQGTVRQPVSKLCIFQHCCGSDFGNQHLQTNPPERSHLRTSSHCEPTLTHWGKLLQYEPGEHLQPQRVALSRSLLFHDHTEMRPVASVFRHQSPSFRPPRMNLPWCLAAAITLNLSISTGFRQTDESVVCKRRRSCI